MLSNRAGQELQQVDTQQHACSVEWCPTEGFSDILACATYTLKESSGAGTHDEDAGRLVDSSDSTPAELPSTQSRNGGVSLYKLTFAEGDAEHATPSLVHQCTWSAPGGVLDTKWCRDEATTAQLGSPALACALSTGEVCILAISTVSHNCDVLQVKQLASSFDASPASAATVPTRSHSDSDSDSSADSSSGATGSAAAAPTAQRLCLSLDWLGDSIIVSESTGTLALWRVDAGASALSLVERWCAHSHPAGAGPAEAWIAFFNRFDANFIISGADDALMKAWDARASTARPAFVSRRHGMGVTCGEWHPRDAHAFVTGSYDETVRVWDARRVGAGPVRECAAGGGVWRAHWWPGSSALHDGSSSGSGSALDAAVSSRDGGAVTGVGRATDDDGDCSGVAGSGGGSGGSAVLAACMHGGAKVLRCGGSGGGGASMSVVGEYAAHESMVYGADWCRHRYAATAAGSVVATCSFYDHRLCLWRCPRPCT